MARSPKVKNVHFCKNFLALGKNFEFQTLALPPEPISLQSGAESMLIQPIGSA